MLIYVVVQFKNLFVDFYLSVQKALEKNDAGDHFPVIAFNLGGNLVIRIVSEVSYLH